jgi:glycosyltransferase involved in cell wall biosynthesis
VGQRWQTAIASATNISADSISVIRNSIPDFALHANVPRPITNKLRFLFAGKVGPGKGVDILMDALAAFKSTVTAWECTIAGDGPIHTYANQAAQLGIGNNVRFTGWISSKQIHELMMSADVVILPSRGEGLPVSLVEGACAGAALVATNVGSVAEVLEDGCNGYIVQPTPEDICRALSTFAQEPQILRQMQLASRRIYLERFRIQQMADRLTAAFREVVDRDRTLSMR